MRNLLFALWAGGAIAWLQFLLAVRRDEKVSFPIALLCSLLWPISGFALPLSQPKPDGPQNKA